MSDDRFPAVESNVIAIMGWLVAGVPIFVSALQAVSRIIGVAVGEWPLFGALANIVHSLEIFRLMSLTFDSSEPVILLLFILISVSWLVVGLSLFRPTTTLVNYSESFHRSVSLVSAFIFALLFGSIYWDLWQESLTVPQRGLLVLFPAGVFGGLFLAYWAQPRTNGYRLLDQAERKVNAELDTFSKRTSELTSELTELHPNIKDGINPDSVIEPRRKRAFEDVLKKITEYRERSLTESERETIARKLYDQDVRGLDGQDEYKDVEANIRQEIATQYREQYANVTIRSDKFGRPYELINRESYRSFDVQTSPGSDWETINVNAIENVADEISTDAEAVEDIIAVINATVDHFDNIRQDLESREQELVSVVDTTTEYLDCIEQRFTTLPAGVGTRLEEIYRYGHVEGYDTIGMIHAKYGPSGANDGKLDRAIDDYHQCLFSDAMHAATEAKSMAEHLDEVTAFIEHIINATNDGVSGVEIPDLSHTTYRYFDHSLIENELGTRIEGVRLVCDWEDDRIGLNYTEMDGPSYGSTDTGTDDGEDEAPPSRIENGVELLLHGIATGEFGTRDGNIVAVRRMNLPSIYAEEEVMEQAADHLGEQDDLIADVDRESLPDHVEFQIVSGEEFRPAMEKTTERYKQRSYHTTN